MFKMDTFSTEIISKSYSSLTGQNKYELNRMDYYSITKNNSSEIELFNEKDINSTKSASNPTIGQLSAQVMNLPYNKYEEVITDEEFESPMKFSLKEYDILKRIKEAYDACSCRICRCLMGPTLTPREEYCDCEPCKCKDCTLNNLKYNTINVQPRSGNEFLYIDNVKETSCDCKPCNCMECAHSCYLRSKPVNYLGNKMDAARNELTNSTAKKISLQKKYPTHDIPVGINKLSDRPITTNNDHANNKCACSKCECVICESQGNALTCYSSLRYGDKPFHKLTRPKVCKCATCKDQPILQSIDYANCGCDMCHFVQCERSSEPRSHLNKLNPDNNHGGSNKPFIDRIMREHPLAYECNEYEHDTFKRGNIFYVNNVKTHDPSKIILRPEQARIKENKLGLPLPKDTNQNSKNKSQRKLTLFNKDNTVLTAVFKTNSLVPKNSLNNISAVFYPCLNVLEDLPMNNVHKTSSYSFSSGFSSTRTITASVLSYQNKGCSKRTISLPDTNIFDNLTEIGSNSNGTEVRKYVISNYTNQHNIYHCSNIESDFNKINGVGAKLVRKLHHKYPNGIGNRVAGNVLFDHLNQFFTKRCYVEETNTVNYNSIYKTVLNAKQFTINLTKILHKYEKANLEFKSVSKKLKKSLYMILNGLSSSNCDCVIKQAADDGENNRTSKATKANEADAERFKVVYQSKFKNLKGENKSVEDKAVKNVNIDSLKNYNKHLYQPKHVLKIISNVKNKSQNYIEKMCDETDDTINRKREIKSAPVDKSQVHGITGQEPVASEVELLRAEKIRYILKQDVMLDLFTE
ncbi:uncharacterized protein LOC133533642 [Cydia pomonella]|uniref:uncharacterized protein LOC133533642 n=1 Tax=Cydia pomonella TaxID=82600 RepID=UPI002ADDEE8A|nr:uncharacterized protein LOC133533642 [Cydia pomonella]